MSSTLILVNSSSSISSHGKIFIFVNSPLLASPSSLIFVNSPSSIFCNCQVLILVNSSSSISSRGKIFIFVNSPLLAWPSSLILVTSFRTISYLGQCSLVHLIKFSSWVTNSSKHHLLLTWSSSLSLVNKPSYIFEHGEVLLSWPPVLVPFLFTWSSSLICQQSQHHPIWINSVDRVRHFISSVCSGQPISMN